MGNEVDTKIWSDPWVIGNDKFMVIAADDIYLTQT